MARSPCDLRLLLLAAAAAFIYIQVRLFATQSHYADRLAEAEKSENQCTSQLKSLIDQISMQQEKIVALEEMKTREDEERAQLKILVQDLEKRSVQKLLNKNVVPVAAVVIMACNRPDYLERTVESILKYQTSVASKFPLFISQDGTNGAVKKKALDYKQITYMQGSSMGQFFEQYLEPIRLNDVHIDWNSEDLSYLWEVRTNLDFEGCHSHKEVPNHFFLCNTKDKFLTKFGKEVASATPLHGSDAVLKAHNMAADVRIQYNDQEDFERVARQFGIFEEWKDGIPRTAYKGVVVFRYKSSPRRIFLVSPDSLRQLGV
ncbi:Alpha-1,3-mannosyl-glycoprotein 2-beta-N-acetylglucosaminyltransferase [Dichanthelium oligosanthes]|uniref:Alpha-1,3-mannosyl-glycoprotein 2-beta-N-acetylglucosaminyltransferase n=1 Tax=Dichanthelium oligosanthes TaxID=888268 RepID=A0A1E5V310_9POAL|nr:Alpha-1,3-mannosyl-glycoprotein 2-beta-N-acetylglucosaminyltransferase [Dichanthelium oligosanthes]